MILGAYPGVWHTEDFVARELAPTVVHLTYRHGIDDEDGGKPTIHIRSSIWRSGNDAWRMVLHKSTRVLDSAP